MDFAAAQDLRNVTRWLLNFDQRQLVMETKEYYLNATYRSKFDAYRQYMTDVLWLMIQGEFLVGNNCLTLKVLPVFKFSLICTEHSTFKNHTLRQPIKLHT